MDVLDSLAPVSEIWCCGSSRLFPLELRQACKKEGVVMLDNGRQKENATVSLVVEVTKVLRCGHSLTITANTLAQSSSHHCDD